MQSTLKNRTLFFRDNLDVLRGIDSSTVDLIYLDPPFNKKKSFSAPVGSSAEGASFSDVFRKEDVKEEWIKTVEEDNEQLRKFLLGIKDWGNTYNFAYLAYMAIRLLEMHRILKDTGSIYLHCDPTMSHYLKLLLDCVFGEQNFRSEIVWWYRKFGRGGTNFKKNHDIILYYVKNREQVLFNELFEGFSPRTQKDKYKRVQVDGKWKQDKSTLMKEVRKEEGVPLSNTWEISFVHSQSKERTGYPTQKPLALLERIIQASSNEGDLIFDPFCGCATTCIAAEKLGRKWVGIDVSIKAYELVQKRLRKEVANPEHLFDSQKGLHFSTDPPKRTDTEATDVEKKYVYIISHPSYPGEYKVGIAKNWKARLNSYQTSDPNRGYKLEYKLHTPYFREVEQYIHAAFENKHEWVKAELHQIKKAIDSYLTKITG